MFALAVLVLTAGMVACDDDDDGTGPDADLAFSSTMNGANERPNPVTTNGTGTATFTLNATETSAAWQITVTSMSSNITNAHIHLGNANTAGGVIVQLAGATPFPLTGPAQTWSGTLTSTTALSLGLSWQSLIDLIRNGDAYVNVHTVNFGAGEIRGQLVPVP
jgi:hypothetical protein